jgi:hypothetical protein
MSAIASLSIAAVGVANLQSMACSGLRRAKSLTRKPGVSETSPELKGPAEAAEKTTPEPPVKPEPKVRVIPVESMAPKTMRRRKTVPRKKMKSSKKRKVPSKHSKLG